MPAADPYVIAVGATDTPRRPTRPTTASPTSPAAARCAGPTSSPPAPAWCRCACPARRSTRSSPAPASATASSAAAAPRRRRRSSPASRRGCSPSGPSSTNDQLKALLKAGAVDLADPASADGSGRVDVARSEALATPDARGVGPAVARLAAGSQALAQGARQEGARRRRGELERPPLVGHEVERAPLVGHEVGRHEVERDRRGTTRPADARGAPGARGRDRRRGGRALRVRGARHARLRHRPAHPVVGAGGRVRRHRAVRRPRARARQRALAVDLRAAADPRPAAGLPAGARARAGDRPGPGAGAHARALAAQARSSTSPSSGSPPAWRWSRCMRWPRCRRRSAPACGWRCSPPCS